jgi:hypothetical protein
MAGKIFANYRRGDNAGFTQGLDQRLEDEFTAGDLFHGCGGAHQAGNDFVEVLNTRVAACDVVLTSIIIELTEAAGVAARRSAGLKASPQSARTVA